MNKSYDVAITHDRSGAAGRLHHVTYMMDSREDLLRAADTHGTPPEGSS